MRSAYELVVVSVGTDPEPMDAELDRQPESPVVKSDPHAVEASVAHGFEVQGRVCWVGFDQRVVASRQCLRRSRQRIQALPETFGRGVIQSARDDPAR